MLRISKLTDYAIVVLGHMARGPESTYAANELAGAVGVAIPTVSKILKLLAKAEILRSTRGAKGGYALVNPPHLTSVALVIYAMEGPIALTECEGERGSCDQSSSCHARSGWEVINRAVKAALQSVTLADMNRPFGGPQEVRIPVSSVHKYVERN